MGPFGSFGGGKVYPRSSSLLDAFLVHPLLHWLVLELDELNVGRKKGLGWGRRWRWHWLRGGHREHE